MRNAQNSVRGTSTKTLGAVETRDLLKRISGKGFDPYALQDIKLHSREVALFAAEILRPLRIAAISAELPQLTWLLETTFYEAFTLAQPKKSIRPNETLSQFDVL